MSDNARQDGWYWVRRFSGDQWIALKWDVSHKAWETCSGMSTLSRAEIGPRIPMPDERAADPAPAEGAPRQLLVDVERTLIVARQLIDGWYNTTPANEWSAFDEETRQLMTTVHGRVADWLRKAPGAAPAPAPVTPQKIRDIAGAMLQYWEHSCIECRGFMGMDDVKTLRKLADWMEKR